MRILLVDDERNSRESVAEFLTELGHQVTELDQATYAMEMLEKSSFPLIITDIRMPGMDGIEFLRQIKDSKQKNSDVIVYTGHGDIHTAIAALRLGAYDYLQKPINVDELALLVERTGEHQALLAENEQLVSKFDESLEAATTDMKRDLDQARTSLASVSGFTEMVTSSEAMQRVIAQALIFHRDPEIPVLIEGETGTGKEIVSRLIHFGTANISTPFVDINCASLSSELFESELFGYEAGAFTGGKPTGERGKMALAENGTLLLDEIGDLPLSLQPKLLRVLQDRSYYPVGGLRKLPFQARIICATNQNLKEMVEQGRFRRDLYYRLNVGYLHLPALRERPEEIGPLAEFFLRRECTKKRKNFRGIDEDALDLLRSNSWPGNIRELENTIERAILCADGELLKLDHLAFLSPRLFQGQSEETTSERILNLHDFELPDVGLSLESLNQRVVSKAMTMFQGNKTKTASYLGITRNALYSRLKKVKKEP
jgi:two-component system, NtrC family, response regulator AtoC